MAKITVADRLGNTKTLRVGFSFGHLFFGPLYSFFKVFIFTGIFEILYLYFLLPLPGMDFLASLLVKIPFLNEEWINRITRILMFFRTSPYRIGTGITIASIIHLYISVKIGPKATRKYMKRKELLPVEEKDARILIKYHAFNEKVSLAEDFDVRKTNSYRSAEENWYESNHERLANNKDRVNTTTLTRQDIYKTRVEQIEKSYQLGLISKGEYERRLRDIKNGK
jgi:hypothetical protein